MCEKSRLGKTNGIPFFRGNWGIRGGQEKWWGRMGKGRKKTPAPFYNFPL